MDELPRGESHSVASWVVDFRNSLGHAPRILHIGNIANNAFLNARALNAAGFDCDVLCYDYYHVMGCPEWEEADFKGTLPNQNRPNWRNVDLADYQRPAWFAQGSLDLCALYLIARRKNRHALAWMFWNVLLVQSHMKFRRGQSVLRNFVNCVWWLWAGMLRGMYFVSRFNPKILPQPELYRKRDAAKDWGRRFLYTLSIYVGPIVKVVLLPLQCGNLLAERTMTALVVSAERPWQLGWWRFWLRSIRDRVRGMFQDKRSDDGAQAYDQRLDDLQRLFTTFFPDRQDMLTESDFQCYAWAVPLLEELLSGYDLVQGYSTSPAIPLLCGKRPYIAFEHGTLRSLPFELSSQGRTTALAYRMADAVIITNCDNRAAAQRLGLEKFQFIPHPVCEKQLIRGCGQALRAELEESLATDFVVFHPARHDWSVDPPSNIKSNHELIDGLCRYFSEVAPRGCAIFVEWGAAVAKSKQRIREAGCERFFHWMPPVGGIEMAKYVDACDALADQFFLGAFGAIVPKGLALGKPVLCYVDSQMHEWCFDQQPPVVNVQTCDEIFEALVRICNDDAYRHGLAEKGPQWYRDYHSIQIVRQRLTACYESVWANRSDDLAGCKVTTCQSSR